MKKLIVMFAIATLYFGAPSAQCGKQIVIPVDGYRIDAELLDLGYEWFSILEPTHAVQHARSRLGHETWDGGEYVRGEMFNHINWDANYTKCSGQPFPCNVAGDLWGTAWVELDEFDGGWDGSFRFEITDKYMEMPGFFSSEGIYSARGWGDLEGWYLELYVILDGDTHSETFTGFVISPRK